MYNESVLKMKRDYSGFIKYILAVIALHIIGIALIMTSIQRYPQILGMAVLSYTLGLRHAFDADHIAAIDNTVRKLVQQREDPKGVGFLFSFGHSTVVIIMAILTVCAVKWTQNSLPQFQKYGGTISLAVSGGFLLIIGLVNLFMWKDIFKTFLILRRGVYKEETIDYGNSKGIVSRLTGAVYKSISKGWHVYVLGFIEIAQLVIPILGLNNRFFDLIQNLNFNTAGYILVGLFIVVWGISYAGWKFLRIGDK